jgi:hypothetical protein
MMDQLCAGCPMGVQGADVTVADTDGGVALTFTTDAGNVADLRTSVKKMAQMYETHHGYVGMMWDHMGDEGLGRGGSGMGGENMGHMARRGMPAARNTVTDTIKGARLAFWPTDPAQLDALRTHVRWHQERMLSGECWGQPTKALQGEQWPHQRKLKEPRKRGIEKTRNNTTKQPCKDSTI